MNIIPAALAFLALAPAKAKSDEPPTFTKRPWHSRGRLDIRPVLWSLRNRPQDWRADHYTLTHVPSAHKFWIANGFFFYGLWASNGCSCQREREGAFSIIQKFQFGAARRAWARATWAAAQGDRDQVNAQFASHFIPKQ